MDYAQDVGRQEAVEIGPGWKNFSVSPEDVFEDPRRWIYGFEVGECVEAAQGRCFCKLFRPLSDCHAAIDGFDTTDEDIKAVYNKGGVGVFQCLRCEVVQGRQTDSSIQRYPERPRDAMQVQHSRLLLQPLL